MQHADMTNKPACLVTGCAGFVGSHLAEALLDLGYPVVGVDNLFTGRKENMESFRNHPGFCFYPRSITESDLLPGLQAEHPSLAHVLHLAAVVSVPWSLEHPDETMAVNHLASLALYGQARDLGMASFVFAGSAAEYGEESRLPIREEYAGPDTVQLSPYGRAKFLVSDHVRSQGWGVSLRFFNIYGPRQDPSSPYSGVISRFASLALDGQTLTIHGDGGQTRDFLYVADAVDAYLAAAGITGPAPRPGVYNVGTGKGVSVLELAEQVADLAGHGRPFAFREARPGDIRHSLANTGKITHEMGFTPSVPLAEGLRRTLDWERSKA